MNSALNKLLTNNKILQKLCKRTLAIRLINSQSRCSQKMASNQDLCTDIVWLDLEMTGLDVAKDKILEISCLITDKNLNVIAEGPSFTINHPEHVFQHMDDWCMKTHYESGLVDKCLQSNITTETAEHLTLEFLKQHVPKGECPLGGNSVYTDRLFLSQQLPSVNEYMHYRIIDVSTIKELTRRWNPKVYVQAPKKRFAHRSLDDIYESIAELKYYRQTFFKTDDN